MTIADRTWDHLPPEIHARVMASTAHAQIRRIQHGVSSDPSLPRGVWTVDALTGDRYVHQILGLRADDSVFEETRTFVTDDILDLSFTADGAALTVAGPEGPQSIVVPDPIGQALGRRKEPGP